MSSKRQKMAKNQLKVPKRVGGVKLPRMLRKPANRLTKLLDNPLGREVIAEGLVAMAGVTGRR